MKCFISAILFVSILANIQGQNAPVLPQQEDWFLSSGNWQNDPQLYIRELGTGPDTIIMLHGGWGGEYSGLLEVVEGLEEKYHFVFYDQRGSLRSPFPDSLISFSAHIEDLELLRRALKLEQITIVGHSMGATLAGAYAFRYPGRVKKLILLAPAYLKYPIPSTDTSLFARHLERVEQFINRPEVNAEFNKYALNRTDRELTSQEETAKFRINLSRRMLYDPSNWIGLKGGRAIYKGHIFQLTAQTYPETGWDYPQAFEKHGFPVGIITGDHDFLDMGNELIKKWTGDLPNVELSIIKNAGHVIWLDRATAFRKAFLKHLEEG